MNIEIKSFYLDISVNGEPTIGDVLNADFNWLERNHRWCQRAFPNFEPSEAVPDSPVLDDDTLEFIKTNRKQEVFDLTIKYLNHYLRIQYLEYPHNNKRVTRLLKFLAMLGYTDLSNVVLSLCRKSVHNDFYTNAIKYWHDAIRYKKPED